ncbi:hypothetical protein ACR78B_20240, partial [Sphingobacterium spiritivorum]|uniref:hypothetical protein n=2 Tax=Sphingobacterium spiritivorum TaxID=258 RepID=UPI003DA4C4BF
PARADGIAVTGGRVGRCLFLYESPFWKQIRAFLFSEILYLKLNLKLNQIRIFQTSLYKVSGTGTSIAALMLAPELVIAVWPNYSSLLSKERSRLSGERLKTDITIACSVTF